jgi:hypothetical protein
VDDLARPGRGGEFYVWLAKAGRLLMAWWRREVARLAPPPVDHTSFSDAVAAVEPLLAGVGVRLGQVEEFIHHGVEHTVRGQSEFVQILMRDEPMGVFVELAPLGYTERHGTYLLRCGHPAVEVDKGPEVADYCPLETILRVVAPEVRLVPRYVRSSGEMREEVERQVHLLLEHCRPMLEGDFSAWPSVLEASRVGPAEGETREAWVSKMKQMLSEAMEIKDYPWADQVCFNLKVQRANLTPEERDACRLATRELERLRRG